MELELREHQIHVVNALREGFKQGHRTQLLYAPTGFGKTEVAIYLMKATRDNYKRAAMVLDRIVLVDQTSNRLTKYGITQVEWDAQFASQNQLSPFGTVLDFLSIVWPAKDMRVLRAKRRSSQRWWTSGQRWGPKICPKRCASRAPRAFWKPGRAGNGKHVYMESFVSPRDRAAENDTTQQSGRAPNGQRHG